jgi:hypothetical protein
MRSVNMKRRAAAIALVVLWTPVAQAASAIIVAPGAQARSEASETATVLHTFDKGEKVFVSPEVTSGFRRVQLPDKRRGYIRDDDVRVEGAPSVAPVQPISTSRPLFIVSDIDQIADLTKDDSLIGPRARELVHNRHVALGVGVGAMVSSLLIGALSFVYTQNDCIGSPPTQICQQAPDFTFSYVAGGVLLVGGLIALGIACQDSPVAILNDWNQRHPDRPLTIAPGTTPAPDMTPWPPAPVPTPGVDFPIGPPP